jgi:hypothetical protein
MFHWIRAIAKFPSTGAETSAIDQLVQLAAERSLPAVRERLTLDCTAMSAAEFRGYARARAQNVVRQQSVKLMAERNVSADLTNTIISRALDRTAHTILRRPQRQPVMPLPAAHVQLRIAG